MNCLKFRQISSCLSKLQKVQTQKNRLTFNKPMAYYGENEVYQDEALS